MQRRLLRLLLLGALCVLTPAPGAAQQTALISNLAALRAAAADSTVTTFLLQQDIVLNGTAVDISRPGQAVTIAAAAHPCNTAGGQPLFQFPGQPSCPSLSGAGLSRILRVTAGSLTLRGLQFTDGAAPGNGGLVQVTLTGAGTFENLFFARASATALGGALYFAGLRANMTGITVRDSSVSLYGGGIYLQGDGSLQSIAVSNARSGYYGGAIFVSGTNNATNVNITQTASFFGGGAITSAGFGDCASVCKTSFA